MPSGELDGTVFHILYGNYGNTWWTGNGICIGAAGNDACTSATNIYLLVADAIIIDKKLDDGLAQSGDLIAGGCIISGEELGDGSIVYGDTSYAYDKDSTSGCGLVWLLD